MKASPTLTATPSAQRAWFHAVDLVCENVARADRDAGLYDPLRSFAPSFTGAVIRITRTAAGKGYLATSQARHIMRELGRVNRMTGQLPSTSLARPACASRIAVPNIGPSISAPALPLKIRLGHHPRHRGRLVCPATGLAFLQWTQLGRDRFTAGEAASYTEMSGQAAFAF
jgi:hypothetical protein